MRQQITDTKINSHTSGEADECLFEYLHAEMVNYALNKSCKNKVIIYYCYIVYLYNSIILYKLIKCIYYILLYLLLFNIFYYVSYLF